MEGMNKDKAEVACWITFVNMKTKAVLLIEKGTGKALLVVLREDANISMQWVPFELYPEGQEDRQRAFK